MALDHAEESPGIFPRRFPLHDLNVGVFHRGSHGSRGFLKDRHQNLNFGLLPKLTIIPEATPEPCDNNLRYPIMYNLYS